MSITAEWTVKTAEHHGVALGATVPFDAIEDAGTYVCEWSGHLLRVPDGGLLAGHPAALNIVGSEPLLVTKISGNPYLSVDQARRVAAGLALHVDF